MPDRPLREGFVDSERVNSISDWAHRVYSHLLVRADDTGRIDARPEAAKSHLFPLGTTRRAADVSKAFAEMKKNDLVILYEYAGKPYLQVTRWRCCGSSKTSRFPWKDGRFDIVYVDRYTNDGIKQFVSTSIPDDPLDTPSAPPLDPLATGFGGDSLGGGLGVGNAHLISSEGRKSKKGKKCADLKVEIPEILKSENFAKTWRDWCQHRTQIRHPLKSLTAERQLVRLAEMGPDRAIAALEYSIGNGWQGIFEPSNAHARQETPEEFGRRNAAKVK